MAIESNVTKQQIAEHTRLGFWDKWTFCDYIKRWGNTFPDKEALIDPNTRLTWSQYKTMMDRMALHFLKLGIKRDDLVVTQIPNRVEAIIIEMALARIGACIVPLAMQWREHELNYVIGQTEAPVMIVAKEYGKFKYVDYAKSLRSQNACLKHIIVMGDEPSEGTLSFQKMWDDSIEEQYPPDYLDKNCTIDANDVLTMCYTSGTEADPKGCPRTHNHWKAFERSSFLHHLTENVHDKVVMALPWINLFGQSVGVLSMAMVGGTLILLDGFNPATMAQTIHKEKATLYAGVPAMHVALLNYPELDKYDLSSLRVIASGGAPCPKSVILRLMEKGCLVWNGFGSNEGTLNTTEVGVDPEIVSTTIGLQQLYSEVKIVDPDNNRLGVGIAGEYCQKAPFIIAGYYKRPDLNRDKWDDEGFYHSGDACYLDEDGFYHFSTRLKDIIIRGGMNISAEEVEFILYKHPQILNVAIVGMPDDKLGERCCAYVEIKPGEKGLTVEEAQAFMEQEKVAKYKWPERIEIVEQLPRTPTGKVLKYVLREDIAEKLGA
ncbi:MAG TPA: class I adenylate-forming enzyme family protein [Syntrophales bacterium]|nr:class I adenylate-forming enzyme family protein [Syntrophales bacterium]